MVKVDEVLTVEETAKFLKMTPHTVYQLEKRQDEKRLPSFRVGGSIRFRKLTLLEWIERQERSA